MNVVAVAADRAVLDTDSFLGSDISPTLHIVTVQRHHQRRGTQPVQTPCTLSSCLSVSLSVCLSVCLCVSLCRMTANYSDAGVALR